MRISDWSSDVCSSDLPLEDLVASIVAKFSLHGVVNAQFRRAEDGRWLLLEINARPAGGVVYADQVGCSLIADWAGLLTGRLTPDTIDRSEVDTEVAFRSEEHTSELQSLMRISYAVFCL